MLGDLTSDAVGRPNLPIKLRLVKRQVEPQAPLETLLAPAESQASPPPTVFQEPTKDLTFQQWLDSQVKRDDPIGDLSLDISRDSRWPRGADFETMFDYVEMRDNIHATEALIAAHWIWKGASARGVWAMYGLAYRGVAPWRIMVEDEPFTVADYANMVNEMGHEKISPVVARKRLLAAVRLERVFTAGWRRNERGAPSQLFCIDKRASILWTVRWAAEEESRR